MAFSNTYDVDNNGSAVSNRENLTDVLTILAPEETPILSSAQKQRASATNTEWTVDSLSAPNTNGIVEGDDVGTFTDQFAGRARMGNYTQKFRRDYRVSDLQEAVDSVGQLKLHKQKLKQSVNLSVTSRQLFAPLTLNSKPQQLLVVLNLLTR